ncbi:hypothetical protein EI427_24485 [Flammeovirga pectinis]|uniref:Uncharacterized protein n=1 Tax=Flammeovirga pectinis TaxID=2494373 RepID=A0A3S9PB84_9BACT|nr:hypothetical protein [Flammeovirga pectinis]AZQ65373.1 hypothetical protein EI427_24485 [Flammeovirga pectinis]
MKNLFYILFCLCIGISCTKVESNSNKQVLTLNEGNKWKVDTEMKSSIDKSQELILIFNSNQKNDYNKLANDLKYQNDVLIKSCTMTGESHEMLHKWLVPNMKLIDSLSKATKPNEQKEIVVELIESYNTFNTYFN